MVMANVITNEKLILLDSLRDSFRHAKRIKFIVSFVMESGVRLILPDLQAALRRGAEVEILTSRYLNITEPSALYLLQDQLGGAADIRIFACNTVAFHPKTYIFMGSDGGEVYVGSSNLSASALVTGVEWNYCLRSTDAPQDYERFISHFDSLFSHSQPLTDEWLKEYSLVWRRPRLGLERAPGPKVPEVEIHPRGPQIEALHYLDRSRAEGFKRGMVVMATGTGKTYLSAFDSKDFRRVLFVAHREEILRQARESFDNVAPGKSKGWFNADAKSTEADIIFASIQTLSQEQYLNPSYFSPDYFDYMVVDEFHHVAAESYQRVVNYFQPRFMLGMTATPFRMDNQDIFQFCEDNVVYEINLQEAINKDYLVPFHYYGIYDDATDYSLIDFANGRYVGEQLERALSTAPRAELILKYYREHKLERALAFCSGINHANYMAEMFKRHGVPSAAVHSGRGPLVMERQAAVAALRNRDIEIIFSVDQFNEGVDIPEIDLVLFLRPTESYTIFLQQLGRGLRKYDGKDAVTVLDFIGNYRKAHLIPLILTGRNPENEKERVYKMRDLAGTVAEGCTLNFDMRLVDVFEELRRRDPLPERLQTEYFRLKAELGRRPLRIDVHTGSDISSREFLRPRHLRPERGYLQFLASIGELDPEEEKWLDTDLEAFLLDLETTAMSKLYKIPTIRAFIHEDALRPHVSSEEVGRSMQAFYQDPRLYVDMQDKSSRGYEEWPLTKWVSLAERNPINFLDKSSPFFEYDQINKNLRLAPAIFHGQSLAFVQHVEDILQYRQRQKVARLYKRRS